MNSEKFVVAFWRDASIFPNVADISIEGRVRVYWTCITTLAMSLRRYHSLDCAICVATNDVPPDDLQDVLNRLNVEIVQIPFVSKHLVDTATFGAAWYLIDVMAHIAKNDPLEQVSVFLDPDCLITGSLDTMVSRVRNDGLLLHEISYPRDHKANGLSRADLSEIAQSLTNEGEKALPIWVGGELIAGTGVSLRAIVADIEKTKAFLVKEGMVSQIKTEEHLLSLTLEIFKPKHMRAHPEFISRIWTTGSYRNYSPEVMSLPIWHLPAEKQRGFPKTFQFLSKTLDDPVSPDEVAKLAKLMALRGPTTREVFYILKTAFADLKSSFSGKIVRYRNE